MTLRALLLLGLTACLSEKEAETPEPVDTDGDGLTDDEEAELGTEPENIDSDGDSLTDGEEVEAGLDPNAVDTDGDGYEDGWETLEGSDPADPDSGIYVGGWPYNPDKDQYSDRTWDDAEMALGAVLPWFEFQDQYGDTVNIYDFAGHDKYVLLDLSAMWCGPCNGFASWLSGEGDSYGFSSYFPNIEQAVHNGDIYWITILGEDMGGATRI